MIITEKNSPWREKFYVCFKLNKFLQMLLFFLDFGRLIIQHQHNDSFSCRPELVFIPLQKTMDTTTKRHSQKQTASSDHTRITSFKWDPSVRSILPPLYLRQGLTQKHMDAIYLVSHHLFEQKKYREACPLFEMMTFLDCYDKRAWLGSAACFEAMKEYPVAAGCYKCAALLDESDPMPFFRSFNCYLGYNDKAQATSALEAAIEIAGKQEGLYSSLKEQAIKLKEVLLK